MAKKIAPQTIKNLPSRLIPHVSEREYIELQKGIRTRFDIIGNILSGIVQGDIKNKRKSAEDRVEGSPEGGKPDSPDKKKKKKKLLPEAASTGLAFAAGALVTALSMYFEKEIMKAAKELSDAVKSMLGFDVEKDDPEKFLGPPPVIETPKDITEIEKIIEQIEARPGANDNPIFKSGPNDDTIDQLTDEIEDKEDEQMDELESNDDLKAENAGFPDPDITEAEINKSLQEAEDEDNADDTSDAVEDISGAPIRKTKAKPGVIKEAAPSVAAATPSATAPKKKEKSAKSTKAKDARRTSRSSRPPKAAVTRPLTAASSSTATGGPVQDNSDDLFRGSRDDDDDQGDPEQDAAPSTGTATKSLVDLIKGFEGFSPKAHPDYGQFSNGYGTRARFPTEEITEEEAELRLLDEIARFRGIVEKFSSSKNYNWNSKQIDALTSFIYNLGPGALKQVTNDGKRTNSEIAAAMLLYDKAGGSSLPGLTNRRKIESNLFNSSSTAEPGPAASSAPPPDGPSGPSGPSGDGSGDSGNTERAPPKPTNPAAHVAIDSETPDEKAAKAVIVNTPPNNVNSSKTTGDQPPNNTTLSAGNQEWRDLAATHGKHSFGKTGTGTIAGI